MIKPHWFCVPKVLRDLVWATYVPGQERRMDPSPEYLAAAQQAVEAVAVAEGEKPPRAQSDGAHLRGDRPDRWVRVAVTGHRPRHLSAGQADFARRELARLAAKLRDHHATTTAISGMALGADTWWATAALDAGLRLWAYVPFTAQAGRWPEPDRKVRAALLARAERTLTFGEDYDVGLLHARNEAMIRDADMVVAVYDPARKTGGTASALAKAAAAGKPTVLVDVVAGKTRLQPARPAG